MRVGVDDARIVGVVVGKTDVATGEGVDVASLVGGTVVAVAVVGVGVGVFGPLSGGITKLYIWYRNSVHAALGGSLVGTCSTLTVTNAFPAVSAAGSGNSSSLQRLTRPSISVPLKLLALYHVPA